MKRLRITLALVMAITVLSAIFLVSGDANSQEPNIEVDPSSGFSTVVITGEDFTPGSAAVVTVTIYWDDEEILFAINSIVPLHEFIDFTLPPPSMR